MGLGGSRHITACHIIASYWIPVDIILEYSNTDASQYNFELDYTEEFPRNPQYIKNNQNCHLNHTACSYKWIFKWAKMAKYCLLAEEIHRFVDESSSAN